MIRHPVLRYVVRVISCTILCRHDVSKVRESDMTLLYYCIGNRLSGLSGPTPVNMTHVFLSHLMSLKIRPFQGRGNEGKFEHFAMFFNPSFQHFGVRTMDESYAWTDVQHLDLGYLHTARYLNVPHTYIFTRDNQLFYMELPKPHLTQIANEEQIHFKPPREYLIATASSSTLGESSSGGPAFEMPAGIDYNSIEPLIPPQYAVSPNPDCRIPEACN